jgi:hypothetical protein
MHLSDEQLERVLHGEEPQSPDSVARAHLADCESCAGRLNAARRDEAEILELLGRVDRVPPTLAVETVAAGARTRRRAPNSRQGGWRNRAAAIIATVTLAGVAYATPGSPLPALARRVAALVRGQSATPIESPHADRDSDGAIGTAGGMKFTPDVHFTIRYETTGPSDTATVAMVDGTELTIRVPSGTSISSPNDATVVVTARTTADLSAPRRFEIDIPRTAQRVEIFVRNRRVFLRESGTASDGYARDSAGRILIPLKPPGV